MELFKKAKKQPIKFRGFEYSGFNEDYPYCNYYYKELPRDNFELMELILEGTIKKPEVGGGTKVSFLDAFMSNHLYNLKNNIKIKDNKDFIHKVVTTSYADLEKVQKDGILKQFTSKVPAEIRKQHNFNKYIEQGYEVLYCSNNETALKKVSIINIVLVKTNTIESPDERFEINRTYTIFKPFKYMTKPSYLKGESKDKYFEEELPQIVVNHDILK
jgi:hypothetical protein